jgi:TRAP-type C4-dicarboxylate transport system permease small subunit
MRHSLGFNQSIGRRVKELQNETSGTSPGALVKGAFFIGSAALLLAMSIDAVAVLGRHLGWPLLGAIELVQACIVLAASAAIIVATLRGAHARVHILTERLPERWQRRLEIIADVAAASVFLLIAAGSAWMSNELWGGHEQTELLHIPLRWLRLFWLSAALLVAGLFVVRAVRGR